MRIVWRKFLGLLKRALEMELPSGLRNEVNLDRPRIPA